MVGGADDPSAASMHGAGPPGASIIVFRHAKRKRSDDGRGEGLQRRFGKCNLSRTRAREMPLRGSKKYTIVPEPLLRMSFLQ
jgi:hypothetical protein